MGKEATKYIERNFLSFYLGGLDECPASGQIGVCYSAPQSNQRAGVTGQASTGEETPMAWAKRCLTTVGGGYDIRICCNPVSARAEPIHPKKGIY
jgi:hypothetical protein